MARPDEPFLLEPAAPDAEDLRALVVQASTQRHASVRWAVSDPAPSDDAIAEEAGLTSRRDLFQLRRPLPVGHDEPGWAPPAPTRPLRPGTSDESAWVEVNNRAFVDHPDQRGFTLERLHREMAQPWFDAAGLRLHERGPRLAGSCWTKIHPADPRHDDPAMGEIYAIGVDPDFQGLGLGRALTLAGLVWLHGEGLATGMLYVDATNTPAVALYESMGFTRHHVHRLYEAGLGASRHDA